MTGSYYQQLAMRTSSAKNNEDMLHHAVYGLTSEAGEVSGIMQKLYQGHPMDRDHMVKELGDCLWMIAEVCEAIGTDLDTVMYINIQKLRERYPNGFETARSLHRKEGDI